MGSSLFLSGPLGGRRLGTREHGDAKGETGQPLSVERAGHPARGDVAADAVPLTHPPHGTHSGVSTPEAAMAGQQVSTRPRVRDQTEAAVSDRPGRTDVDERLEFLGVEAVTGPGRAVVSEPTGLMSEEPRESA